jgi:hypothetical protein
VERPRKVGPGGTARAACRFCLALATLGAAAQARDLPQTSPYLGEVRRDAGGRLTTITPPAAAAGAPQATSGDERILRVGPGQPLRSIAAAAQAAQDGDTVEIEAGDYFGDVAVWNQERLTIRGVGGRPRLVAAGASAEGKAIWVVRGGRIAVENIEFIGARVPDRNGAGIRFEKGHLSVRNCRFVDNENGILGGSGDSTLIIENSEFGHNGAGDGQSHNLYVGPIRKLTVSGSHFHHARIGHLLKSRAAESHILYNRLTDETEGRASYELEFPNGGIAYVIGNIIEQSRTTENSTLISFGAEAYKHAANELYLVNNTLIDNRPESGTFLTVRPGFQIVKAYNNLLLGRRPLNADGIDGEFINNPNVAAATFVLAERHDYRIQRDSPLHRSFRAPGSANGIDLAPTREYVHPAASRPLGTAPTLPGARQTLEPDDPS